MSTVKPIPDGCEGALPYLRVREADKMLKFYEQAFDAKPLLRLDMPDGKVGHAEMQIAGARIMISDEYPEWNCVGPQTLGGTSVGIMIYVGDVDAFTERALAAGMKVIEPLRDQFYGDRSCKMEDPAGHVWTFATHIEDVSDEEMKTRMAAFCAGL